MRRDNRLAQNNENPNKEDTQHIRPWIRKANHINYTRKGGDFNTGTCPPLIDRNWTLASGPWTLTSIRLSILCESPCWNLFGYSGRWVRQSVERKWNITFELRSSLVNPPENQYMIDYEETFWPTSSAVAEIDNRWSGLVSPKFEFFRFSPCSSSLLSWK